jgi:hypothetical protein
MKLFKKLGLVLALGASLALVGCGGDNPNESTSASDNPTCTRAANWAKISKGLTESNVIAILGSPTQITSTSTAKTFIYEKCRIFTVETTPDDPKTPFPLNEQKVKDVLVSGLVVFSSANNGYVASFTSPGVITETFIKESDF